MERSVIRLFPAALDAWITLLSALLLVASAHTVRAAGVVGTGTVDSCTDAALNVALAGGGLVAFNCGPTAATIDISTGTGTKTIAADTTIDGGSLITISGGNNVGVFSVNVDVKFTVQNLTIANGSAGAGGAISNAGALTVTNSTLSGNSATTPAGTGGGAIYNGGTVTITNSTFSANSRSGTGNGGGGGIFNNGTVTIINSTFAGNSASGAGSGGGGIINGGTVTITNSTFAGNSVTTDGGSGGGAIWSGFETAVTITNSTFSDNSASGGSGGVIFVAGTGTVRIANTLVANSTSGGNCASPVTDGGHNLDDGTSCGFSPANGSLSSTPPQLDAAGLQNNGGPSQTIALLAGSPVINAGDESICAAPPVNNLDQRGYVRPGVGATNCSIGAYEYNASQPPSLVWNLAADFRIAPDQENPSRDTYGNLGVWHYLESSTLVRDPATYTLLPSFGMDGRVSSLEGWCDPTSSLQVLCISINASGSDQQFGSFVFPAGVVDVHPLNDRLVIVGWRSPIAGSVIVTGGVTDLDTGGGNGIAWFIAQGATDIANGVIDNGGAETFADGFNAAGLGAVGVIPGDFLYFIVDPRDGNFFNDSTRLDVTITQVPATSLVVSGTCMQPGAGLHGLAACTAGTMVKVFLCKDTSCAPDTLVQLATTHTAPDGQFFLFLDAAQVAGKRLVFDATIVPAGGPLTTRGRAASDTAVDYQIIDFGPVGNVTSLSVMIDPSSVAAKQLLEQTGLRNFTDTGIRRVNDAVRTANQDVTFAGQSADTAVILTTQTASNAPAVQQAIQRARTCALGDCHEDGQVTVDESLTMVNIALGSADSGTCPVADANGDGKIMVDEILTAVNNTKNGCGSP